MNLFIDSGDHYDEATGGLKWSVFDDSGVGSGYNDTQGLASGITVYTRPRSVIRVAPSPSNEIVWGFRWRSSTEFPLSTFYVAYILGAVHGSTGALSNSTKQLSLNVSCSVAGP